MADHFSQWEWASWASGGQSSQSADAIRVHLDAGCEECQREQSFWSLLSATMRQEREPLPRHWAEWTARAWDLPHRAAAALRVRLVFDSRTAAIAPVRGTPDRRRRWVYELESDEEPEAVGVIEVSAEPAGPGGRCEVVGQVLNPTGGGWRDCVLELTSDQTPGLTLQTVRSNAFGEFCFSPSGKGPWRIELQAGPRRWGIPPVSLN